MNKNTLYNNCIFSSIVHALMMNIYPELSYEQSWDEQNFSFNNGDGVRGTITFRETECIGAIRNDNYQCIYDIKNLKSLMQVFPSNLINIAYEETFLYLLDIYENRTIPSVTSIFAFNNNGLINIVGHNELEQLIFFNSNINSVINYYRKYYVMNEEQINLSLNIFNKKLSTYEIKVNKLELYEVFRGKIETECETSLNEMGIYLI